MNTEPLKKLAWSRIKKALYSPIPVVASNRSALSSALMNAALVGGIGLAFKGLSDMASAGAGTVENTLAKGVAFQNMLEASGDLQAQDPRKVKAMFDVVYQFFPSGAAQPVTAAGIVSNLSQYDTVDHKTVSDLISMQKSYAETTRGLPDRGEGLGDMMASAFSRSLTSR